MGQQNHLPGKVRDAIVEILSRSQGPLTPKEIELKVVSMIGPTPASSIRSYLSLNTPNIFSKASRGTYNLRLPFEGEEQVQDKEEPADPACFAYGQATMYCADCFEWITQLKDSSIHAVVTDPPYGLFEYSDEQQAKLRSGKGGVWRIPPSFDGHERSPLPRFTTLTPQQLLEIRRFFYSWGKVLIGKLVPGAHVLVASNPLLSYLVSIALSESGLERRGEIIRLTMTMRGGDRPKAAHDLFPEISVMPRSMWEPWLVYRKPLEGRVQDNLRKWKTGGLRRPSKDKPFGDVIASAPTRAAERQIAAHPSLKPQAFLRQIVRAVLPLGEGVVLDPFAGSGSTLAAAEAWGYRSIGIEKDPHYFNIAVAAIPGLASINIQSFL